jgi:hypothetical protein
MNLGRIGELAVRVAGNVAGTVVEPRQGLARLRSVLTGRTVVAGAVGVGVGWLLLWAAHRRGDRRPTRSGAQMDETSYRDLRGE